LVSKTLASQTSSLKIPTGKLAKGIYFINILQDTQKKMTKKLMVN